MKIFKIIGIVLLSLIAVIVVLGLVAPKDFKVQRSVIIPTNNKEVVFKNISKWTDFLKWNPWMAMYPHQKITFNGEEGKVGSGYMWEDTLGDGGKGEMSLTGFNPYEKVDMDLHFIEPFETTNKTVFTMTPENDGYKVNWEMSGSTPFPLNIMHLFMDMDKMVGSDFEKGLNNLKEKAMSEATAPVTPPTPEPAPSKTEGS